METYPEDVSNNNGSYSISVVAGGAQFATEGQVTRAFDNMDSIAASYGDKDFDAELQRKRSAMLSDARRFSATKNTVYAQVSAAGHGNYFDRKRGWMKMKVKAKLYCVGPPSAVVIQRTVSASIGLPNMPKPKPATFPKIHVANTCDVPVRVAVSYKKPSGEWVTRAWFQYAPKEESALRDSYTDNRIIYYYAEGTQSNDLWSGDPNNKEDSTEEINGKTYTLIKKRIEAKDGLYHLRLSCES